MEEQKNAVRKMQEYIRDHLLEDISMEELAKSASFSPWYARKLFLKYLGMSPAVYQTPQTVKISFTTAR